MTLTVDLHNCAGWVASTAYVVGDRRSNDTAPVKAYQCTTAGTSAGSGGPTGTGASITDGGAVWKYLSAVDYTTITAAIAGVGTLSQPTVLQLWNDAEWQNTAATFSGNSTTSTNTLTLTAAPGESFVDNANASTNALRYNQANGVGIIINSGYQHLITINETYVILSRLQISAYASNSNGVSGATAGTGIVIDQCIFDDCTPGLTAGGANSSSLQIGFSGGSGALLKNTAIIVNACTNGVFFFWPPTMANVTIVRTGNNAASGAAFSSNYGSAAFKNVAAFGFTSVQAGGSTLTATTCMTDVASPPTGWTGGKTFANQFQNTGSTVTSRDFRTKTGADLIDAGTTDTTNIPTAKDIVGTSRPQGSAWDIGAWELVVAAPAAFVPSSPNALAGVALAAWAAVSPMPPARQLLPPSTIAVPVNAPPLGGNDFNQPQVYTALGSWTPGPDAPRQTLRSLLPASLIAVPVNAPPVRGAVDRQQLLAHPSWLPANPPPATQRFFFTVSGVAAAVQPPFGRTWLSSTLGSWQSPLDAPRQTPKTQILSVDQPSPHDARDKQKRHTHLTWLPVDQPPAPRSLLPSSITAVQVNNPPGILPAWQSGVLSGWLPGPDAPRQTPPTQVVSVDLPPRMAPYGQAALASWQQAAPPIARFIGAQFPIGSGGNIYSASLAETAASSDVFTSLAIFPTSISDTAITSDGFTSLATFLASFADTHAASDAFIAAAIFPAAQSDSAATSDLLAAAAVFPSSIVDTAAMSDAIIAGFVFATALSDSSATADQFSASQSFSYVLADIAASSDTFASSAVLQSSIADIASVVDLLTTLGIFGASHGGAASSSDTFTAAGIFLASSADMVVISDAFTAVTPQVPIIVHPTAARTSGLHPAGRNSRLSGDTRTSTIVIPPRGRK